MSIPLVGPNIRRLRAMLGAMNPAQRRVAAALAALRLKRLGLRSTPRP